MADPTYTLKQFGVDAAMLFIGTTPIGPSVNGYTFNPGAQWRTVEADGFTTEQAGMSRVIGWDTHLTGRVKQLSADWMLNLRPGAQSDGSSPNNALTDDPARSFLEEDDYLRDVRLVYRRHDPVSGDKTFGAYIIPVARVVSAPQSGGDNDEQVRDIDLKAILAASQDPLACPYFEVDDYDEATFDIADYVTLA